jgi:hypothetical protein
MITRKEFVKSCAAAFCATGMCRATKASPLSPAEEQNQPCNGKEFTETKNRADAAQLRFARLIEVMEQRLPESDRKQLLHSLGAKCADTYRGPLLDRYQGDIHGFLEEGLRNWMAEARYDEKAGTIRIVDKGPGCSCPMVKQGETPGSFCDCTLGWQEAAYSYILGRPVRAELEESILRGGKRCVYRIQVI